MSRDSILLLSQRPYRDDVRFGSCVNSAATCLELWSDINNQDNDNDKVCHDIGNVVVDPSLNDSGRTCEVLVVHFDDSVSLGHVGNDCHDNDDEFYDNDCNLGFFDVCDADNYDCD